MVFSKFFYTIIFIILVSLKVYPNDVYESNFFDVEVVTLDANKSKKQLIDNVKELSFYNIFEKILDKTSLKKFNNELKNNIIPDHFVKNIIIDNEIITNEKYIANIKVNFQKDKIINFLRNNAINYTDVKSEPFLIVSSYNIDFNNIGLNNNNLLNINLEMKLKNYDFLINYEFPELNPNDRYILSYEKIIKKDIIGYNKILSKYNLNQLIVINVNKSKTTNKLIINFEYFHNNKFIKIGKMNANIDKHENQDKLFTEISDEIILYLLEWWKKEYQINNNLINLIECKILTKSYNELIEIKSIIQNYSQIKNFTTKKIELNSNIVEFTYYGDFKIILKKLLLSNLYYRNINGCSISFLEL